MRALPGMALGFVLAASPALAQNLYVAGDFGLARASDACRGMDLAGITGCKNTASAWRVSVGYDFTPNWGAELGFADYGSAALGVATVPVVFAGRTFPVGASLGQWKAWGYELAGIGTMPLSREFGVFGKLGLAQTTINLTVPGTRSVTNTIAWGFGAKYAVTRSFAIRVQYERIGVIGDYVTTRRTGATLISGGVVFRL